MKYILLTIAFAYLGVQSSHAQGCDNDQIMECLNGLTTAITDDPNIATDQTRLCPTFQRYIDCLIGDACSGVTLPDSIIDQAEQSLQNYGFNCNLDFSGGSGGGGGTGGAAGLSSIPIFTFLIASIVVVFALVV